jgi:hypothetical protein
MEGRDAESKGIDKWVSITLVGLLIQTWRIETMLLNLPGDVQNGWI